ncbi:MAG: STT3 domain-containing protein [Thermoprotei archaeon]|nr:STT3 domain-containing protein [Thermoprotei archaeon]
MGEVLSKTVYVASRVSTYVILLGLILVLAIGAYVRMLPAINYGMELDEADPFSMYWVAEQFREHGLFNFKAVSRNTLFWYPQGRDFLRQEYIGTSWLAAATYPLGSVFGLTLREWIALFPVFAGVLTALLAFILVYVCTGSKLGGLLSAAIFSVTPGAIARSTVGFVEKMVVAGVFITLFYIFLVLALKAGGRARLAYSIAAGVFGGFVAFTWGGYHFIVVSLSLIILVDPLIFGAASRGRLAVYATASVPFILLTGAYPGVGFDYFVGGLGTGLPAVLALYALQSYWDVLRLGERLFPYTRLLHLWLVVSAFAAALVLVVTGTLRVPGRILLALGVREFSPLAESVAEHASLTWGDMGRELGLPLIFSILGLSYYVYRLYSGRRSSIDSVLAGMFIMTIIMAYAAKNMAYFLHMASYYASITAGLTVGLWMSGEKIVEEGKRRGTIRVDDLRLFIALTIIGLIIFSSAYYARSSYDVNRVRAPQILTSGLGVFQLGGQSVVPLNDAWIRALEYMRTNTSEDALIVSWWDYGYWISVDGKRRSVADGSTYNETQIRILARILTGNEDEASYLLRFFRAQPNNTYIVFYEAYIIYRPENLTTAYVFPIFSAPPGANSIIYGAADFPKSFQMLRIGYRINPFAPSPFGTEYSTQRVMGGNIYHYFPGFIGEPRSKAENVLNSLIYRLSVEGLNHIPSKGILTGQCNALANATTTIPAFYDPATRSILELRLQGETRRFTPEAIFVSCFQSEIGLGYAQDLAVIVFMFKWTG